MKNKIHLGISSVYNQYSRRNKPPVLRNRCNSVTCQKITNFSVSSTELDDMFLNNLQLLNDDNLDTQSLPISFNQDDRDNESVYSSGAGGSDINPGSSRYQSSLNIFIKPKPSLMPGDKRHSSIIDYSYCDVIPVVDSRQKTPVNSRSIYSSFETLYDQILYPTDESTSMISPRMTQSHHDGVRQYKSTNFSEDSDEKTLKSGTSSESIVSSLESDNDEPIQPPTNPTRLLRPPTNPHNVIISRPLGNYPPRDSHHNHHHRNPSQPKSQLSISPSCNILNNLFYSNQYNYQMHCQSNQELSQPQKHQFNMKDGPPKVPIRKKHRNMEFVNTSNNTKNNNNNSQPSTRIKNGHNNRNCYQGNDTQGQYHPSNNNTTRPVSMTNLAINQKYPAFNGTNNNPTSNSPYSPRSTECIKAHVIKRTKGQMW